VLTGEYAVCPSDSHVIGKHRSESVRSGVGCYLGLNFVGALAYADDNVLLAPTPSAMRILLQICDSCAAEYDINFNPDKSKFLVISATKRRHLYNAMCKCCFFVGNKMIDNVDQFSHVGHIITSSLLDGNDIVQRHNTFVGQTNNVLCFFNKLNTIVKLNLFKLYCTSIYGAELWAFDSANIETFCVAWHKALRRITIQLILSITIQLPFLLSS